MSEERDPSSEPILTGTTPSHKKNRDEPTLTGTIRLQAIKQRNDALSYLTYIPRDMIELLGWTKGDAIEVTLVGTQITLAKQESAYGR